MKKFILFVAVAAFGFSTISCSNDDNKNVLVDNPPVDNPPVDNPPVVTTPSNEELLIGKWELVKREFLNSEGKVVETEYSGEGYASDCPPSFYEFYLNKTGKDAAYENEKEGVCDEAWNDFTWEVEGNKISTHNIDDNGVKMPGDDEQEEFIIIKLDQDEFINEINSDEDSYSKIKSYYSRAK